MKSIAIGSSSIWKATLCVLVGTLIGACVLAFTPAQKAEAFESECITISSPASKTYSLGEKIYFYYQVYDPYTNDNIQAFNKVFVYRDGKKITEESLGFVKKNDAVGSFPGIGVYLGKEDPYIGPFNTAGNYTLKIVCLPYNMKKHKYDTSIAEKKYPTKTVKFKVAGATISDSASKAKYIVTKANKEVRYVAPLSSKSTSVTIPAKIKSGGKTYKVTSIAANAFKNAKKVKTITIKSTSIKSIGKGAFKNINKKAKIKLPKAKYASMKKLFTSNTGFKSTMKLKKA